MIYESKCCGAQMSVIKEGRKYYSLGVCPHCYSECRVRERYIEHSKIFHAALHLLKNIYKGMIIVIAICFLLPTLLLVLTCTHVIRIDHKITLLPLLRSYINTHDLSIEERTE